jgi:glucokinase
MNNQTVIGIDIGGTKIHIGKVSDGNVVNEICLPTNATNPEQLIIDNIIKGIEQLISPDVVGIGIGVPGLVDEKNGIVYNVQNIPSWKEVHLKEYLESHFSKPVYISNDANCFAQGEKIFGKGEKYKNLVGITLGTGLGTGIIINNKLHTGILSAAGEFGCIPYLQHTYEYYCSGKFFKECYKISGKEVYERALLGDLKAIRIFDEYGDHLGNLLKTVLFALGPEAIFLGGTVTRSYRFFQKSMMESLHTFPFKMITSQLVLEVSNSERIAVMGAAALTYKKSNQLKM